MPEEQIQELGRLRPQLVSFAMLRLRDRAQAEDAVQDALVAALESLGEFAGRSTLRSWIFGILSHKVVDILRRTARTRGHEMLVEPADVEAFEGGERPEQALERKRMLEAAERSLARLSRRDARALVLQAVWGEKVQDIARELRMSPGSCWVCLHRSRQRLRECPRLQRLVAEARAA